MNVNRAKFRQKLLRWFQTHRRRLPWRENGNPYRIFIVEVMLQQTQIKTVIPYYERWLKAFPNVRALARAPLDRVLKLWEGLGYYTRARNLHKAAQIIVRDHRGKIPSDAEVLRSLPGIGPYTSGAIASIAFGKPVPLVDGNVARVLSRVFYIRKDILAPDVQRQFYRLAERLVPNKNPGAFNQALMELGSLVCIPDMPRCHVCPVKSECRALAVGNPSSLPVKSKNVRVQKIRMAVGLLRKKGRVLVRRRPDHGIWGGLFELPGRVLLNGQSGEEALKQEFKEALDLRVGIQKKVQVIEHRLSHRQMVIHAFSLKSSSCRNTLRPIGNARWASEAELKQLSFPVPYQKILNASSHYERTQ